MLDSICFRDEYWLSVNVLNEQTALDYFATSQFYDKQCNNEILRMQTQFSNLSEIKNRLEEMEGIEFMLANFSENLFIIHKIQRRSKYNWSVISVYYILFGNIYMAPTNLSIYKARIANSLFYLNEAIDLYLERWKFDPFKGVSFGENNRGSVQNEDDEEIVFAAKIINDFNQK
ncbi:Mediator of RNA polymerase II transcription subunit 6 [Astathelohania contejeani]|uniref:Mediator of RNA polymerase II transcription subunit 6 n=1 Tax=Astathelohania contejeani TaxID=164912 RepID=A0ABQ7I2E5_9MICR|nr:Mediator of RNA polymerase II transcription subunit 6 [Thelohania contejeani]